VAEFVGKSNIFPGMIGHADGGKVFSGPGFTMPVPDCAQGEALVLLRPEDVEIAERAPSDGRIALPVTVASSTYSGDRALYTLNPFTGNPILAYGSARSGVHPDGAALFALFAAENAIVLD
jgi:ABC-type Fe3+/spermidine/putrescine transport system ATPase subunit